MAKIELSHLEKRHRGISEGIALAYSEAAQVCLGRHHSPPCVVRITLNGVETNAEADWMPPTERLKDAWRNSIDTTEYGAYCLALAAIEVTSGLFAIYRAETKSGADYYLTPKGTSPPDLENLVRLEVSGIDRGTPQGVESRLRQKLQQ